MSALPEPKNVAFIEEKHAATLRKLHALHDAFEQAFVEIEFEMRSSWYALRVANDPEFRERMECVKQLGDSPVDENALVWPDDFKKEFADYLDP
jgi:hypothetical protein